MSYYSEKPLMDDVHEAKPRNHYSPGKLIALTVVICGLVRLAIDDPLGIASLGTPCRHSADVRHTVAFQFRLDVSPGTVDAARTRMLALKDNCFHPYTGQPYIMNITDMDDGTVDETHTFVLQFESTDERDYFLIHDPAFLQLKKDLTPLTDAINLGFVDVETTVSPSDVATPDP